MARYYEETALIEFVKKYTPTINGETTMKCVARSIREAPTADVVPKSEVDMLHHLLKDAWKRIEELNNLCGDLQKAKTEATREIFEEIENAFFEYYNERSKATELKLLEPIRQAVCFSLNEIFENISELKKKYTEGESNG